MCHSPLCHQCGGGNNHSDFGTAVENQRRFWVLWAAMCCRGHLWAPVPESALAFVGRWRYLPYGCHKESITDKILFINRQVKTFPLCFRWESWAEVRWWKACSKSLLYLCIKTVGWGSLFFRVLSDQVEALALVPQCGLCFLPGHLIRWISFFLSVNGNIKSLACLRVP